nr:reverse transcriptase domain-containing protein [Tanacetum cinerariifolium]
MPRECLAIIESKSKVRYSQNKPVVAKVSMDTSTSGISPDVAKLKDMVKALLLDKKSQNQDPATVKVVEESCVTCGVLILTEIVQPPMATFIVTIFKNLFLRPPQLTTTKEIPAISYDGHQIPPPPSFLPKVVENEPKETKDTVTPPNNGSTKDVQPPVVQTKTPEIQISKPVSEPVIAPVSAPKPSLKSSIPCLSRRNNKRNREKSNNEIKKFYQIFQDMSFEISFPDALILMPKFASTLKALIRNKEKLSEMDRTPLNEHCSVVLLKKLPEKLGYPGKFLIPCDFSGMDECLALADLGASINLIPLFVWKRLSLPELTLTCHNIQTSRYSASYNNNSINQIDVIEMACEEYSQEVLRFSNVIANVNPTPYYDPIISTTSPTLTLFGNSDFLLEEVDAFLALEDDPTSLEVD